MQKEPPICGDEPCVRLESPILGKKSDPAVGGREHESFEVRASKQGRGVLGVLGLEVVTLAELASLMEQAVCRGSA